MLFFCSPQLLTSLFSLAPTGNSGNDIDGANYSKKSSGHQDDSDFSDDEDTTALLKGRGSISKNQDESMRPMTPHFKPMTTDK